METTISGLADGLFMLSLVSNKSCNEVLSVGKQISNETIDLKVYPNPGMEGDTFTLLTKNNEISQISISDAQGKILKSWSNPSILTIPFVSIGVYFIKVDFKNKTSAQTKLVVK